MAETYTDDLLDGYDSLRQDRDWSVEAMADSIERQSGDAALAAQFRAKFAEAKPEKRAAAPKGRRAKADAESTEG